MKKTLIVILISLTSLLSCDKINENLLELTQSEVAAGLKEALNIGSENAVNIVGIHDGFYKNSEINIQIPEEVSFIKDLINIEVPSYLEIITRPLLNSLDGKIDIFEEKLNRAAENASQEAKEVFWSAITQMTITDAISILKGSDDAATSYLKKTTSPILYEKFTPIVSDATDKIQLAQYWETISTTYNAIVNTGIIKSQPVDVDLNNYVTEKALDGLFTMVAKEELKIRTDPTARVTDILKTVFGSGMNPHNN